LPSPVIAYVDRTRTPAARISGEIVADHHKVEAAEKPLAIAEVRVSGELQHKGHGVAITLDSQPRFLPGFDRLLSGHGRNGVFPR
jgi:hypothetical protein